MSQPPPEPPRDHVFAGMNEDPDISTDPEKPGIDSAERVISNLPIDNTTLGERDAPHRCADPALAWTGNESARDAPGLSAVLRSQHDKSFLEKPLALRR